MANSITKSEEQKNSWRYIYGALLSLLIIWIVLYSASFLLNIWFDKRIAKREWQLQQIEEQIKKIGSEKAFFSYTFAQDLAENQDVKRAEQITALTNVLKKIQNDNKIGGNAIHLSDFSISPTELSLRWKVSDLILLYYSSEKNNYTNLIDRFVALDFLDNISIKQYDKIGRYYEFTLHANINSDVIIQK